MRSLLVKTMKPLHAQSIESPITALGIPDVNYKGGWLECKDLKYWPKRADTNPVKFKHPLTKEQGIWLWKRSRLGGTAMCVCRVSRSWFFFDGLTIRHKFDKMTRPEMIEESLFYMPNNIEKERMLEWLTLISKG